jgi:HK97 family phage portal protein
MSLIGKALALRNAAPSLPPVPVGAADGGVSRLASGLIGGGVSQDAAYLRAYKSQGTVFSNVSLLAESTAGPQWRLFRSQQDGRVRYTTSDQGSDQRVEVVRHAALSLLNRPNPFWSRFKLFEMSQLWLDLTGKSYWVIDKRGGVPIGIWPVRPDRMHPVPDPDLYLKGWVYRSPDGRELIPLAVDDVVFNALPDPEDPYGGTGPAQSVLTEIDGNRYASEWNRNFFANSARPDGVIQVDKRLSDEEWDELTDRWREAHRGVARAHRVAVLEAGATWQATSTTPKDMDFGNLLSTGSDRIREAWGVHKVMTGIVEDVNRANAQTGEEIFAIWKINPRLRRWRDVFNHQFLPMFGQTGQGVEFDFDFPMPVNREQDALELTSKSTAVSVLVNAGYDPHDVLQFVGVPDMNVVEQATQQPALPPGWVVPPPAGAPDATAAAAMERLRASAGWDSPAWRELAAYNRIGARS